MIASAPKIIGQTKKPYFDLWCNAIHKDTDNFEDNCDRSYRNWRQTIASDKSIKQKLKKPRNDIMISLHLLKILNAEKKLKTIDVEYDKDN